MQTTLANRRGRILNFKRKTFNKEKRSPEERKEEKGNLVELTRGEE